MNWQKNQNGSGGSESNVHGQRLWWPASSLSSGLFIGNIWNIIWIFKYLFEYLFINGSCPI